LVTAPEEQVENETLEVQAPLNKMNVEQMV
jgi:hypothetical protein